MIKKTVRDQVYTLETYLKYVNDGDICENADVQRLAGNFDQREINELVYTILTGDHLPELILAECNEDNHTYIADGLQRTTMLKLFRYGRKITSSIDNPIIDYMCKKRDEKGNVIKNERGQVELEEAQVDIRNKTYTTLPDELKKAFNDFQVRVVIHEDCSMERISELIKRYNYQRPMTSSQKAFTYIDKFAVAIREISNKKFFVECSGYKEPEKVNGTIERVITESVMCMFHFDAWKKSSKSVCEYLNKNSNHREFSLFKGLVDRLGNIVNSDFEKVFTSKNSFIWFKLFYKFTQLGLDDEKFAEFIAEFNEQLKDMAVLTVKYKDMEELTYSKLDKESGTKDKVLILAKLEILESLMTDYFDMHNQEADKSLSEDIFIADILNMDINEVKEDLEFYKESLNDLTREAVKDGSRLLDKRNQLSLLAMMAYSYQNDVNLDDWLKEYAKRNNTYLVDQEKNFLHMKADFENYINKKKKQSA